ncbi:hypothetical protein GPALN_003046 [Globodera pallida]|nr:hypothetical protein GPALN_003046 [Globodera pallida]
MRFSRDQLDMLELAFQGRRYLSYSDRENLCAKIGVAEWQVKGWFQNRRAKNKRSYREAEQLFSQHNAATDVTFAVPEQSVAAAAPSAAATATVRAAKSANRCGKGRRRAVTARTKTTRQAAGGKRKSRRGTLRTKAVAADANK